MLSTWWHFIWAFKTGWSFDKQRFGARGISRARGKVTQVRGWEAWGDLAKGQLTWWPCSYWARDEGDWDEGGSGEKWGVGLKIEIKDASDRNVAWWSGHQGWETAEEGKAASVVQGDGRGRSVGLAWHLLSSVSWQTRTAPLDSLQLFQFLCYSTIRWTLSYFQQKSPWDHIGLMSTSFFLWQIGMERKILSNFPNFNFLFLSMLWALMGFMLIFRKILPML